MRAPSLDSTMQLVAGGPGDAANIGARNAEISKVAISAKPELVKVLPVLAILLDAVAKAHFHTPLFFCPP
ncbi:hypothetical protein DEV91_10152 [Phyllobacterium brassicacearum]|nr:hypothetical protein DEV91_10152 [Phyllobacterium brassicacearum]